MLANILELSFDFFRCEWLLLIDIFLVILRFEAKGGHLEEDDAETPAIILWKVVPIHTSGILWAQIEFLNGILSIHSIKLTPFLVCENAMTTELCPAVRT